MQLIPGIRSRLIAPPFDDLSPGTEAASEEERRMALDLLHATAPITAAQLCHGDLSPGNVLVGRDRFWLIDPRGINGETAFDIAVAALKASGDKPAHAQPTAAALAEAAGADRDRSARWGTHRRSGPRLTNPQVRGRQRALFLDFPFRIKARRLRRRAEHAA